MTSRKEWSYIVTIILLLAGLGQLFFNTTEPALPKILDAQTNSQPSVYFNQETELNKKLISEIQNADTYVYFAVYTFTRKDLRDALLAAKLRGLEVKGISDKDQYARIKSQKEIIDSLRAAGIPVVTQTHLGIMHLKVLVTDKVYASGSYNWTASGTTLNDEVLEIGTDPNVRDEYKKIVEKLFELYK